MPSSRLRAVSGTCEMDTAVPGGDAAQRASRIAITSGVVTDFAVAVGLARLGGQEEETGARGGEPRGQQLRRAGCERFAEQRLHPAVNVSYLGRAPSEERQHRTLALGRAQEVRDGVHAVREDVGPHTGFVV